MGLRNLRLIPDNPLSACRSPCFEDVSILGLVNASMARVAQLHAARWPLVTGFAVLLIVIRQYFGSTNTGQPILGLGGSLNGDDAEIPEMFEVCCRSSPKDDEAE